jgi:translation initiation factor 3 subunit C
LLTREKFTKALQHTDAHEKGSDYIERLREETPLYTTIVKAQVLFERENWSDAIARAVMRRLEHVYAKVSITLVYLAGLSLIPSARCHHRAL